MQSLQEYTAATASYLAATLALFVEHTGTLVQVLGFVLLVARLIHEIGSLISMVKKWMRNDG